MDSDNTTGEKTCGIGMETLITTPFSNASNGQVLTTVPSDWDLHWSWDKEPEGRKQPVSRVYLAHLGPDGSTAFNVYNLMEAVGDLIARATRMVEQELCPSLDEAEADELYDYFHKADRITSKAQRAIDDQYNVIIDPDDRPVDLNDEGTGCAFCISEPGENEFAEFPEDACDACLDAAEQVIRKR